MREGARWFAMILAEEIQGKGLGSAILNRAKNHVNELNGWVIDHNHNKKKKGTYYQSPLGFYQKNGFEVLHDTRLETPVLSAVKIRWR